MTKKIDDGGPAFPCDYDMATFRNNLRGMTLRQWYAGMALQGQLANNAIGNNSDTNLVKWSFKFADAMIAAEKDGETENQQQTEEEK